MACDGEERAPCKPSGPDLPRSRVCGRFTPLRAPCDAAAVRIPARPAPRTQLPPLGLRRSGPRPRPPPEEAVGSEIRDRPQPRPVSFVVSVARRSTLDGAAAHGACTEPSVEARCHLRHGRTLFVEELAATGRHELDRLQGPVPRRPSWTHLPTLSSTDGSKRCSTAWLEDPGLTTTTARVRPAPRS